MKPSTPLEKKLLKCMREHQNSLDRQSRIRNNIEQKQKAIIEESGSDNPKIINEILKNRTEQDIKNKDDKCKILKSNVNYYKLSTFVRVVATIGTALFYIMGGICIGLSIEAFINGNVTTGAIVLTYGLAGIGTGCINHKVAHNVAKLETEEKLNTATKEKEDLQDELE